MPLMTWDLSIRTSSHCTRSVSHSDLFVPIGSTLKLGERAFFFTVPILWNSLLVDVRTWDILLNFKKRLKTYFYHFNIEYYFNPAL